MVGALGSEPAIAFRGRTYRAQGRVLLGPLDLEVQRGETLVLLWGAAARGKTTALKLINRLLEESEGAVLVDGRPTREWDVITLRRHIGYVIQETGLFPHYTVEKKRRAGAAAAGKARGSDPRACGCHAAAG